MSMKYTSRTPTRRKKRSILLRLLPVAVLLYLLCAIWNMHQQIARTKAEARQVAAGIEQQNAKNEELRYQLEHIDEYRAQLARQRGYGAQGELFFREAPGVTAGGD